jgi:WD40 repeat protein
LADGRYLLSVGEEAYPLLWSLDQIDRRVLSAHKGFVFATEFSPDGKWLVSGGEDDRVLLWDTTSWTVAREFQASGDVWDVKFSPDGAWLAAGSADGKISLWDAVQGERLAFISAHERDVYSLGFAPGGKRLASTGPDMMVKLWDLPRGDLVVSLAGHTDEVIDLAFLPGQSRFATASLDGTVRFWDAAQGQPLSSFDARGTSAQRRCSSVAFSPVGRLMAVGDYSAEVQVFRLDDAGAPSGAPKLIKAHSGEVEALSFSPDGQSLASASWDGTVRVHSVSLADWDEPWESRALQSDGRDVDAVAFSPDGKYIAFASEDEKVHVFTDALPREIEAFRAWLQAFPAPPTETRAASQPSLPAAP